MRKKIIGRFWLSWFMALIISFGGISLGEAAEITASGEGSTERNALHAAMRAAIEQQVGTYIDSRTYTENYQVINDRIYSQTNGYIQNYLVLSSRQMPGGYWQVTIKADVREQNLRTDLMTYVQKKAIVGANMGDPRIGVFAVNSGGQEDVAFENALISSLQNQGFTRLIDLKQIDAATKKRLASAEASGDTNLRRSIQSQFQVDYLVSAQVNGNSKGLIPRDGKAIGVDQNVLNALHILIPDLNNMSQTDLTANVRMMNVNTGEIVYAGSASESARGAEGERKAREKITQKLVKELAASALKKAANPEQHITILITGNALGTMTEAYRRISAIPGVSHVFTRSQSYGNMQVDVDYTGTAYDLAMQLEAGGIKIKEMNSEYIKI